ncbi:MULTISPECIES: recombination-associated protein RdgC [Cupriavidus]|jgi:recombination associated protein RdgC|uniref:Recombination-associated protein RdgC n=1 Tax=Cupriavidus pauculus TaxID=82633 RepID=A0A5P2GY49_9BURK|nr:recombination-associated protein RdgC [Cupriavidus pauculus]QET00597.1 recombination-associated protein RdgC [Cupriavidus pauculus]
MWFKNLQLHRFSAPWTLSAEEVEACLAKHAFFPGTSLEPQTQGWAAPRDNGPLVHCVNQQMLLLLRTEKKLLPATVVNQVTKARAAELEEQQGFKPGRKQLRELKEQVTDELLPRAFSIRRDTRVWIDPVNGWLAIDAAGAAKADEVRGMLFKAIDPLPLVGLHVNQSPVAAMTEWLASDTAPAGFTIDQEIELQSSAESKATVRYVRHPLDPEDLQRHIAAGKRCTRLAMTWNDRVSFVMTESLAIKRVAPLDVIKEQNDATARDEDERFDADFALMAGELAQLLGDITDALGGERQVEERKAEERKAA